MAATKRTRALSVRAPILIGGLGNFDCQPPLLDLLQPRCLLTLPIFFFHLKMSHPNDYNVKEAKYYTVVVLKSVYTTYAYQVGHSYLYQEESGPTFRIV
ncbi:hypothetical protein O181_055887 [Austropuccinia psidii MF-1]|uniref:Uncharacterized protein n=1 Tax=Austropuccinia psidii MF-1 TaxID=1389203 RepID=A0A9Q3E9S3_9BASI|nr:hypothetical protein [Austropuccinia psidii MF-1]